MDAQAYAVDVIRDGKWWMVHIPELDGLTQARNLGEVETMAREWITLTRDTTIDQVAVTVRSITVDGVDVLRTKDTVDDYRRQAAALERKASEVNAATAQKMSAAGVPMRDIARVLAVSFQRVGQILNPGR